MNKVELVGNLSRDPETRQVGESTVCSFSVACNRSRPNKDGKRDADFINCVAWNKTAEFIAKYFRKGSSIGVTGEIRTRSYEAQDGSKRYSTEVLVSEAEFVGKKSDGGAATEAPAGTNGGYTPVDNDDLPF